MLIFAVDDEPLQLRLLKKSISIAQPEAEVQGFEDAAKVEEAVYNAGLLPDVAFLDIEMPEMGGLELAKRLKEICPTVNIVFVTGFSQYMKDAFAMHVSGYVTKPVTPELIRVELENLRYSPKPVQMKRAVAKTFGSFEFFVDNKPVSFRYAKTKELLAYLIDRQGSSSNTAELCSVLWEDVPDSNSQRSQFRNLVGDLSKSLRTVKLEKLLIKNRNSFAVDTTLLDCDMYRFQKQDIAAINSYFGEYMSQYSWAELRIGTIEKEWK